jgi:hypothetical protein
MTGSAPTQTVQLCRAMLKPSKCYTLWKGRSATQTTSVLSGLRVLFQVYSHYHAVCVPCTAQDVCCFSATIWCASPFQGEAHLHRLQLWKVGVIMRCQVHLPCSRHGFVPHGQQRALVASQMSALAIHDIDTDQVRQPDLDVIGVGVWPLVEGRAG